MADARAAMDGWVQRVLGVSVPRSPQNDTTRSRIDRRAVWREAKESVDERLNVLAGELRATEDPDATRIADFGLFGIGKGENVALAKALIEFESGGAAPQSRQADALRAAIAGYRTVLSASRIVPLIDAAPFQAKVGMAATLGAALDRIESSIA